MSLNRSTRRARLSMTSLIDVIFLLLLFFMLSSTFSKFAEIELQVGGAGGTSDLAPQETFFLRLAEDGLTLNGQAVAAQALPERLLAGEAEARQVIVSVTQSAKAQGLADVLASLRQVPGLTLSVIGPG